MCGICGFNWNDSSLLKKMCEAIKHRGPDDKGVYTDDHVSLGHQRLSIIDTSSKGRQPLSNKEGTLWITFNGEIYNYKELKSTLESKGYKFSTQTDTEVIIHLYDEYGPDGVNKLVGMFAFAIWDTRKKQLFIARDRLGIKPLFYYHKNKKFVFGSEIKAILQHDSKRSLNLSSLKQIITYGYILNSDSLMESIQELQPGHYLVYKDNTVQIKKYWDVSIAVENKSIDYFAKQVRNKLDKAVQRRLMSDVPLGATLSGGIDSSAIVALMSTHSDNVNTFTLGFNHERDEFKEANIVAEHCATNHTEHVAKFDDIDKHFTDMVWHYELPIGKPSVLLTYLVSRVVKKKMTVSLIGDGADETFAGYNRYEALAKDAVSSKAIQQVYSTNFPTKQEQEHFFTTKILRQKNNSIDPVKFITSQYKKYKTEKLNAGLLFELKSIIPNIHLNRVDRMSMAFGVEMRVPFMDHELVELTMKIPSQLKWKGDQKKFILQQAVKDLLPKSIVGRRKLPFGMPFKEYYDSNFHSIAQDVLSKPEVKKRDYLNYGNIQKTLQKVNNNEVKDNHLRQVLFLTSLEVWYQRFIENNKV